MWLGVYNRGEAQMWPRVYNRGEARTWARVCNLGEAPGLPRSRGARRAVKTPAPACHAGATAPIFRF